jgi:hypothetical protein
MRGPDPALVTLAVSDLLGELLGDTHAPVAVVAPCARPRSSSERQSPDSSTSGSALLPNSRRVLADDRMRIGDVLPM